MNRSPETEKNPEFEIENGVLVAYHGDNDDVIIPENVTAIAEEAFYHGWFQSIFIPAQVAVIPPGVFDDNLRLQNIFVDERNQHYASIDGVLYDKNITTLVCCPPGREEYVFPESVTKIGEEAFRYCDLRRIDIPDRITSIGAYAFFHCNSLEEFHIPDWMTSLPEGLFFETGLEMLFLIILFLFQILIFLKNFETFRTIQFF